MCLMTETEQLKQQLDALKTIYEIDGDPVDMKDKHFFLSVKEATLPFYTLIESWEEATLEIVKERTVNLHPHQIASTRENYELILMHSYYKDVKRKRYMELNYSIHYIFDQLLEELRSNEHMN